MVIYFSLILRSDVGENYYFYCMFFNLRKATFDFHIVPFHVAMDRLMRNFPLNVQALARRFYL